MKLRKIISLFSFCLVLFAIFSISSFATDMTAPQNDILLGGDDFMIRFIIHFFTTLLEWLMFII